MELNLNNVAPLLVILCFSMSVSAEPLGVDSLSGRYVTDGDIIEKLNLQPGPVWCYSNNSNAILITAPQREREKCELRLSQEIKKIQVRHNLEIDTLKIELDSLKNKHEQLIQVKNKEISDLTSAALKRPGDYSIWWATGGFATGIVTTLVIFMVFK